MVIRKKRYKAREPEETIRIIRDILHNTGLFMTEHSYNCEDAELYSCRLTLANSGLLRLGIGVNGKGVTPSYSLASAYGELMERIQNFALFSNYRYAAGNSENIASSKERPILKYRYAPDERVVDVEDVLEQSGDLIRRLMGIDDWRKLEDHLKNDLKSDRVTVAPYYNVNGNLIEDLPLDFILTSTNGMCAGNTREEALIQGISEIIERYVLKKIIYEELVLPTISRKFFEGTGVLGLIEAIERKHKIVVIIKDCSLNSELPAIGVLLLDRINARYTFHLGADPSPITALERCLTEVYQGVNEDKFKDYHCFEEALSGGIDDELIRKQLNYDLAFTSYNGVWPTSVLINDESGFKGFGFTGSSCDEEDLDYLIKVLSNLQCTVYIRDVSFLGFPSFHIFIDGMSGRHYASAELRQMNYRFARSITPMLQRIKKLNEGEFLQLAYTLDEFLNSPFNRDTEIKDFFFYNLESDIKDLDNNLFMSMLFYKAGVYDKSMSYISRYIAGNDKLSNQYKLFYKCMRDYFFTRSMGYSNSQRDDLLYTLYEDDLVNEVMQKLDNPDDVLDFFNYPSCFDCCSCEVKSSCKYNEIIKIVAKLQNIYEENQVDQNSLTEIFYHS